MFSSLTVSFIGVNYYIKRGKSFFTQNYKVCLFAVFHIYFVGIFLFLMKIKCNLKKKLKNMYNATYGHF